MAKGKKSTVSKEEYLIEQDKCADVFLSMSKQFAEVASIMNAGQDYSLSIMVAMEKLVAHAATIKTAALAMREVAHMRGAAYVEEKFATKEAEADALKANAREERDQERAQLKAGTYRVNRRKDTANGQQDAAE